MEQLCVRPQDKHLISSYYYYFALADYTSSQATSRNLRKPVNKGSCYVNQKHKGKPLLLVFYINNLVEGQSNYGKVSYSTTQVPQPARVGFEPTF